MTDDKIPNDPKDGANRSAEPCGRRPRDHRTVYASIPEGVFNRAKAKALLRNLSWQDFIVAAFESAGPPLPQDSGVDLPKLL